MDRIKIETTRMILKPFDLRDKRELALKLNDPKISEMTANIPYPYTEIDAEKFILESTEKWNAKKGYIFKLEEKSNQSLIGCVGAHLFKKDNNAMIGYWIAQDSWGKGYCSEAVQKVVDFCRNDLKLKRIFANYKSINPASGRVLEKVGMSPEGVLKSHVKYGGGYCDLVNVGLVFY